MSTLETKKIEPLSGTTVTLGAAGDAVTMPAGVTVKTNTVKDAGGNTLWTSNGSGTLSSVNSALSGNMIFIASQTCSVVTSVEFTTGIDNTYDEYVFYFVNMELDYNGSQVVFQGSTDGGSSYGITKTGSVFIANHNQSGTGTTLESKTNQIIGSSTAAMSISYQQGAGSTGSNPDDESLSGEMRIYAPSNTTFVKHWTVTTHFHTLNDESRQWYGAGYWNTTSAINAVKFSSVQGNLFAGTIYLYGIK